MLDDLKYLLEEAQKLPEKTEGEFTKLPDGEYDAVVYDVKFSTSKAGNYQFVWEFIITEGPNTKQHEWKYSSLKDAEGMKRLVTDLNKFGVKTTSIETIEKDLDLVKDVPVKLTITSKSAKNNPEVIFRNVSVKPCNS